MKHHQDRQEGPAKKAKQGLLRRRDRGDAGRQDRAQEGQGRPTARPTCMAKIKEMKGLDREIAEKLHAIVKANAPGLAPQDLVRHAGLCRADGKAVVFFTPAVKFKERYATFGFNTGAKLDDGNMWPTSWAVTKIGDAEEKKIAALVKKAAG